MRAVATLILVCSLTLPEALAHPPYSLAADADGAVVMLDAPAQQILRVGPQGDVSVLLDLHALGIASHPHAFCRGPRGELYVAETYDRRLWVLEPDGQLGIHPWCAEPEDGRGAVQDVECDASGRLHLLRRREAQGNSKAQYALLRLAAGSVTPEVLYTSASGDPDLYATCLAIDHVGTPWLAGGARIYRVVEGRLETLLAPDLSSDSPALLGAYGLAPAPGGGVYVADESGSRIWHLDEKGRPEPLVGCGTRGGTDGPALEASLDSPYQVAVGTQGSVYIAEALSNPLRHRVRVLHEGMLATRAEFPFLPAASLPRMRTLEDFRAISAEALTRATAAELSGLHPLKDWPLSLWVERSQAAAADDPRQAALFLPGVLRLEPPEARALSAFVGTRIFLPDLRALDAVTAAALTGARAALHLDGLRELDLPTARVLARMRGNTLSLGALPALDPARAQALARFKGSLRLTGLVVLDAPTAAALAPWEGWGEQVLLSLGVGTLSADVAHALAACKGWGMALDGLKDLTPAVAAELGQLDMPYLSLGGLTQITPELAAAISQWSRKFLTLEGVLQIDPELRARVEQGCEGVSWRGLSPR